MSNDMVRRDDNLPSRVTSADLEQYGRGVKGGKDIVEEGKRHALAEQIQAAKARLGGQLFDGLHQEANDGMQRVAHTSTQNADSYSGQRSYDRIARQTEQMLDQHFANRQRLLDVAARTIAEEVAKPVIKDKEKKGWFS